MNLFEASAIFGALLGAIIGALIGNDWLGVWGGVLGVPVGLVAGFYVGPICVLILCCIGIFFEEGPKGFWGFLKEGFRGKSGKEPPAPPAQ